MYIPRRQEEDISRIAQIREAPEDADGLEPEEEDEHEFLKMRSNIDKMDEASAKYTQRARKLVTDLIITQSPTVIARAHMLQVAALQRTRFFGCLSLPFSFAFFLFFALSVFLHEDITNVYFIESGLRANVGGGIESVDSIAGCWDWIETILVPTIFNQNSIYGSPEKDKKLWNRVLMYNQLTGPLLIEQVRSKAELCFEGDGPYGDMVCYPKKTNDDKPIKLRKEGFITPPTLSDYRGGNITFAQRKAFWESAFEISLRNIEGQGRRLTKSSRLFVDEHGRRLSLSRLARRLRTMRTEYMARLPGGDLVKKNKYIAFFYPNTPAAVTKQHVKYLRAGGWIDEQTKEVKVKSMLLNAEVGRPRLEQLNIVFRFSRGGGVFARMSLESIFLKVWNGRNSMAADFLFTVMLITVTYIEFTEVKKAWGLNQFYPHLRKPWTVLENLIVFFGWCVLLGYACQYSYLADVKKDLDGINADGKKDTPAEISVLGEELHVSADKMVYFTSWFRILQAEYHLILMFRFFTAFNSQPRLGVITSTLEASIIDIIHFLIVMLPTFMAYAISGCFIFGRRMKEFSTFNAAIGVCFKLCMEGEYDWDTLSAEHYWTAALWTWSFMLLLVLLMMNMVLAIVMDIYTNKRKEAGNSETVGQTMYNLYVRVRHFRRWVSNRDIIEKGEFMDKFVSREDLVKAFPGICDQQLDSFIKAVRYQTELECTQSIDINDSMKMTMAVKLSIDKVNLDMQALQDGIQASAAKEEFKGDETVDKPWLTGLVDQMASHSHWILGIQWQLQQLQWQWSAMEQCHGQGGRFAGDGAPQESEADIVL